mgnify:CR=1 FL=1
MNPTPSRPFSPCLIGAVALLVPLLGCEPEPVPEVVTHPWDGYELDGAVVASVSVEGCSLPTAASLTRQLEAVAIPAETDVVVSAGEPMVLGDDKLGWAITQHFNGLWTLNLDGNGSTSLVRGMPPAVPTVTEDFKAVWADLREAKVCGFSLVSWQFPAATVQTVAWLIDATTFHESVTDSTILQPQSGFGDRTDGRCGSARWIGGSLGADLAVGSPMGFKMQVGICGDYVEPDAPTEGQDDVQPWDLVCGEALPMIESNVPFGHFECGDVEYLSHPRCCAARLTCTLALGLGGYEYSISRTPTAMACPARPWEVPQEDDCETEW